MAGALLRPKTQADLLALKEDLASRIETTKLRDYKPYPKQAEFHAAGRDFRERLLMASSQSGKTWSAGFEHAMHLTGRYPDWWQGKEFKRAPLGWAASESSELTRDGVQRILAGRLPAGQHLLGTGAIPRDAIVDHKRRTHGAADALEFMVVKWGGGGDVGPQQSYIGFKSYDQGRRKFQAETLDFIWFDEEPEDDIYFEGLTRTNTTLGLCSMTFTPLRGMSKVVARFLIEQPPQTHVTRMGIVDALHYTDEQREALIASYPPHQRRARAYGEPTLGSGAIFAVEDAAITVDPFPIPDHWALIAGIDFGWDHPTAASLLAHDRDNDVIYVTRCLRARETTPAMFVLALQQTWGRDILDWLPWAWPHDGRQGGGKFDRPEQEQLQQIYADHGLKMLAMHAQFENGSNGVEPGVQDMLDRMNTGRWKVFATCGEWLEEKRLYHRKDGLIVKEREDAIASSRYAHMMRRYAVTPPRPKRAVRNEQRARNWRVI